LSYEQFDDLEMIWKLASSNQEHCLMVLEQLAKVPGVKPFVEVRKLVKAMESYMLVAPERHHNEMQMELLSLLYAPKNTMLHSILNVLTRIENAGHILAWKAILNEVSLNEQF
jgi:hypothetical protein